MNSVPEYWKIAVVALAGLVGVGLGVDGTQAPRLHTAISGIGAPHASAPAASPASAAPVRQTPASRPPEPARPSAPPAPAAPAAAAPPVGPLLADTRYGAYAYQVYPGSMSTDTQQALTGFQLTFRPAGSGTVEVTAEMPDGTTQTARFASTDRLYFIETRMGDDGFGGETNLGDDGFVLTDAAGHIVGH
ncbi:MAG TPA: hypothetical protein VFL28_14165 [bacterium]|nr:hypothetical protein [bacterium]